jgi:hypothetical protein
VVSYEDAGGSLVTLPVDIRTRGNSRLQSAICRFPPLRLDFPKKRVAGTLFADQDKLKLVTHCHDNPNYEQSLLQEYLVYRTYNELTELSFRVRLARVTYIDTDEDRDSITRYGFLIEHEDDMAARNGGEVLELPRIHPDAMDPSHLSVLEVFQFLVGNIDWDSFLNEPGDNECCHNTKPIRLSNGPAFSIPYDFDVTGVVSARYASRLLRENLERFGLRNVRQRLYRGRCSSDAYLESTIQLLMERREAIYRLYRNQEGLMPGSLERALEYYDDFYEIIGDPSKVRRHMSDACRHI